MKTLIVAVAAVAGYALVTDDRPVFMLTSTFNARIQAERITAARDAIDATEPQECTWRSLYREENDVRNSHLRRMHSSRNPTYRGPEQIPGN
jgi:hypothetical protein